MHAFPIVVFVLSVLVLATLSWFKWKAARKGTIIEGLEILQQSSIELPNLQAFGEANPEPDEAAEREVDGVLSREIPRVTFLSGHFDSLSKPRDFGKQYIGDLKAEGASSSRSPWVKDSMQIVVSLVFLGASIYIILSKEFDPKDKQWAYGSAGTILGFWLKH
jgi:hypothetical protein